MISDFIVNLGINPGWIAVVLGLTLFGMGIIYGRARGLDQGINGTLDMLVREKLIKITEDGEIEKG
tara:strand:+ start:848 stop:1045 length:198 start_codon:yes stop_codon:yes gene_type:complete